ncbi:MAG: hypothetical protein ACFB2W_21730 [Leptolyngbyaceae cyanobacterium]
MFSKKWSSLKIVNETPDQLILKTSPGYRVLMGLLLPFALILGLLAIALGLGGLNLLFTEAYTLGQRLWMLLVGSFFTCLGIVAPTAVFMNAATSELWTFDRRQQILYRVRKRFCRQHRFEYPFAEIARIHLKQHDHDADAVYRIELTLTSGRKLALSPWNGAHMRGVEMKMIEHIRAFLHR